jgi:hypothetical protein
VPPASPDEVGAAAEGSADRLVLEKDLLLYELPEGATLAQLGEVDWPPAGQADEQRQQDEDDCDRRERRRARLGVQVDQVGDFGDRAAESAGDCGAGRSSRPAAAGWSSAARPSR